MRLPMSLRARPGITAPFWTPMHPAGLRCSSLAYPGMRAPRASPGRRLDAQRWRTYSRTGPNRPGVDSASNDPRSASKDEFHMLWPFRRNRNVGTRAVVATDLLVEEEKGRKERRLEP